MKKFWPVEYFALVSLVFISSSMSTSAATQLFCETFNGYPDNVSTNQGVPLQSEGAMEEWFGGRFEAYDGGSIYQDLSVRYGDYVRFEDDAGVLFNLDTTGYTDIEMTFKWKTHKADAHFDCFRVGYYVGDFSIAPASSGPDDEYYYDFYNDMHGGNHAASEAWWANEWDQVFFSCDPSNWNTVTVSLSGASNQSSVWVAFFIDNGEGEYGKVDWVKVEGVPEPATLLLLGLGGLLLGRRK